MGDELDLSKENIEKVIEQYSQLAMKLSLQYVKDLSNNVAEKDSLKYLNEIKRHLSFAKKTYKELYETKKGKDIPTDNVKKLSEILNNIKALESTVGDIVTDMRS